MSVLVFLIPLSLICSTLGLIAYIWAVDKGQFDHLDEQQDMLFEEATDTL